MTRPIVAIVGRPNVGKSTFFNRLLGKKLAIVHDAPGVTRDRHYADAHIHGRDVTLVDTGGFDLTTEDPMGQGIARQVRAAIAEADVVVCVLDGTAPPTGPDREAVQLLRASGKPVVFAANKVDTERQEAGSTELYSLGVPELLPLSALHGRGTSEVEAAIVGSLAPAPPLEPVLEPFEGEAPDPEPEAPRVPRVALVGRPNAGKSSLFNRLVGSERSIVDSRPGTTRDPIDSSVIVAGQEFLLVDTAGVRRKAKVEEAVEVASVLRSLRAIERADVVVLLADFEGGISDQDQRLLGLCSERGRAIVVGLNKADLLSAADRKRAEADARDQLNFARWAPIMPLSAKTGRGVPELMKRVWSASQEFRRRVPTAELNRFFEQVLERRTPPTHQGRAPRVYYVTQAETAPPVFVAMCNHPEYIQESYRRFVANQIRDTFGFESVPLKVIFRPKKR